MKSEKNKLSEANNNLHKSIKTLNKNAYNSDHQFMKKIRNLEVKVEKLEEFKSDKVSEEKEIINKAKKLEKRAKLLDKKEAKFTLNKDNNKNCETHYRGEGLLHLASEYYTLQVTIQITLLLKISLSTYHS